MVLWFILRGCQLIHTTYVYFRMAKMTNINWRWHGRIQLWRNRGNIPAFSWRSEEIHEKLTTKQWPDQYSNI